MADSTLRIRVEDQTRRGTASAKKNIDSLGRSARTNQKHLGGLSTALKGVGAAMAATAALSAVRTLSKYADQWTSINNRLRLVTNSSTELLTVQRELFRVAQDTRAPIAETAELYQRLARSGKDLGVSQERLIGLTRTINQALVISGASADAAKAALLQLGQGFASGTLRGEELNSVMEQTPRLASAIATGMGVSIGKLRELGKAGKLTAESVIKSLESQAGAVRREFDSTEQTVAQAFTAAQNAYGKLFAMLDKYAGVSAVLAGGLDLVAAAAERLTSALEGADLIRQARFAKEIASGNTPGQTGGFLLPQGTTPGDAAVGVGIEDTLKEVAEATKTHVVAIQENTRVLNGTTANSAALEAALKDNTQEAEKTSKHYGVHPFAKLDKLITFLTRNAKSPDWKTPAGGLGFTPPQYATRPKFDESYHEETIQILRRETARVSELTAKQELELAKSRNQNMQMGLGLLEVMKGTSPEMDKFVNSMQQIIRQLNQGDTIGAAVTGILYVKDAFFSANEPVRQLGKTAQELAQAAQSAANNVQRLSRGLDNQTETQIRAQYEALINARRYDAVKAGEPIISEDGSVRPVRDTSRTRGANAFSGVVLDPLQEQYPNVDVTDYDKRQNLYKIIEDLEFALENFGDINTSAFAGAMDEFSFQRRIQQPGGLGDVQKILGESFANLVDFDFETLTFATKEGVELTQRQGRTLEALLVELTAFSGSSQDFYSQSLQRQHRLEFDLAETEIRKQAQGSLTGNMRADQKVMAGLIRQVRALRASEEAYEPAGTTGRQTTPGIQTTAPIAPTVVTTYAESVDVSAAAQIEKTWSDVLTLTISLASDFGAHRWSDIVGLPGSLPKIQRFWDDVITITAREDRKYQLGNWADVARLSETMKVLSTPTWGEIIGPPIEVPTTEKPVFDSYNKIVRIAASLPALLPQLTWADIATVGPAQNKPVFDSYNKVVSIAAALPALLRLTWADIASVGPVPHKGSFDSYDKIVSIAGTLPALLSTDWASIVNVGPVEQASKYSFGTYGQVVKIAPTLPPLRLIDWSDVVHLDAVEQANKYSFGTYGQVVKIAETLPPLLAPTWRDIVATPALDPMRRYVFDDYNQVVSVAPNIPTIKNISPAELFSFGGVPLHIGFGEVFDGSSTPILIAQGRYQYRFNVSPDELFSFGGARFQLTTDDVFDYSSSAFKRAQGQMMSARFSISPTELFTYGGARFQLTTDDVFDYSSSAFRRAQGHDMPRFSIAPAELFAFNSSERIPVGIEEVFDFGDTLNAAIDNRILAFSGNLAQEFGESTSSTNRADYTFVGLGG